MLCFSNSFKRCVSRLLLLENTTKTRRHLEFEHILRFHVSDEPRSLLSSYHVMNTSPKLSNILNNATIILNKKKKNKLEPIETVQLEENM